MWRMVLEPAQFRPAGTEGVTRLGPPDLHALDALYADGEESGERPGFFTPSMPGKGVYFGVREGSDLSAAAGTHLVVPAEGVAAVRGILPGRVGHAIA